MNDPRETDTERSQAKINLTPDAWLFTPKVWTDGRVTMGITFYSSQGDYTFYFPDDEFARFAIGTLSELSGYFRRIFDKETDKHGR